MRPEFTCSANKMQKKSCSKKESRYHRCIWFRNKVFSWPFRARPLNPLDWQGKKVERSSFRASAHGTAYDTVQTLNPEVCHADEEVRHILQAAFRRPDGIHGQRPSGRCCPGSWPPMSKTWSPGRRSRARAEVVAAGEVQCQVQEIYKSYAVRLEGFWLAEMNKR